MKLKPHYQHSSLEVVLSNVPVVFVFFFSPFLDHTRDLK